MNYFKDTFEIRKELRNCKLKRKKDYNKNHYKINNLKSFNLNNNNIRHLIQIIITFII